MRARFESRTTARFRKCYRDLPREVQLLARVAYRAFQHDPFYPALNFKQVHPSRAYYSARIGIHYRAICHLNAQRALWFWIGSHADYDRMVGNL